VYLFIIIIPIVCGFFGGVFRGIIAVGGDWDDIIGIIAGGYFCKLENGKLINGLIGFFIATLIVRAILALLINTSSLKDIIINNIYSEWNYPAWILSFIIGIVICGAIVNNFKLLIGIIIGFIVGIIVDAIIFGFIVTILNIDGNLGSIANDSANIANNLQILTTRYTSSEENITDN
jgi:hypothetical protein